MSMKSLSLSLPLAIAGVCVVSAMPAHAEYYGLLNGRSADVANAPQSSVEVGVVLGDIYEADYQHFGARYNFKASPELMVYGDIGQSEVEDADGIAFGIGAYYQVAGVLENTDLAIRGAYHRAGLEEGSADADFTTFVIEALFSGRNGIGASGNLGWYASIGMHRFDFDDIGDDETELGFGAGVIVPSTQGEFFAGINLIDEMTFGAGYRYFLD